MRPVRWAGDLPNGIHGHPRCDGAQQTLAFAQSDLGIGNRLQLLDDELSANLGDIQIRNGLRPSDTLVSGDFTVEMETGTGKTYVYLRTIFELNRRYGFTKFVVIVPSVAIKEGVYKTLQITEEHFRSLYANTPFEFFLYDASLDGQSIDLPVIPENPHFIDHATTLMDPSRELEWSTVLNPDKHLVYGYIFRRSGYPWM